MVFCDGKRPTIDEASQCKARAELDLAVIMECCHRNSNQPGKLMKIGFECHVMRGASDRLKERP